MLAIKKLPHASKPTVARLRLRRRAQLRTPIPLKVNFAASAPGAPLSEAKKAVANAISAINSNAPALKKISASAVSPRHSAQAIMASPTRPLTMPVKLPRLFFPDFRSEI